jgi:hypothetical protein
MTGTRPPWNSIQCRRRRRGGRAGGRKEETLKKKTKICDSILVDKSRD